MNEANLLAFGCAVTFVAAAGAYVYIRESFLAGKRSRATVSRREKETKRTLRKAA